VFLRVSGGVNSMDGYVRQIDFVCANPGQAGTLPSTSPNRPNGSCTTGRLGKQDSKAVRANLVIKPSDTVKVILNADYLKDDGTAGNERLIAVNPQSALLAGGFGTAGGTGFGIPYDSRFIRDDFYSSYVTFADPRTGRSFPNRNDVESWGLTAQVNVELADDVALTSISGYRGYKGEFTEIWANAPIHLNDNYFRPSHHQFSQELRLAFSLGSVADITVGGYYYDSMTKLNDFIYIPAVGFAFYGADPVKDKDRSAFVHGVFHLTDKLNVEGGVRYSSVSKRYEFNRFIPDSGNPPATLPGFENNPQVLSKTKRPDYRASIQYQWTPRIMTYALISTGFKGPGVNPRPSAIAEVIPFKDERLVSYEIGAKIQGFDNRVRFNIDGFISDYSDLQLSIPTTGAGGVPSSVVANAGKVRIKGIEAELQAEPVEGLNFNASVGYTDFKYRDLGLATNVPDGPCLSCTAAYVSKWQASAGLQYKASLGEVGTLTPRIDWSYRSKFYNDPANSEITAQPGYGLWNARLTYGLPGDHWQLSLQALNLAGKRYYVTAFNQLSSAGYAVGTPGVPRTLFVSARYRF
jgi:iron complex outermembrane receptor protein